MHWMDGQTKPAAARPTFAYAIVAAIAVNFLWADGHDRQRCIELAVLVAALAIALVRGAAAGALREVPPRVRRFACAFLALGALSAGFAASPRHALNEWAMFVMLGTAGAVVASNVAHAHEAGRRRLLLAIALACGAYALRQLLVIAAHLAAHAPLSYVQLTIGFSQYRFLNHAQTALLPLLVLLAAPGAGGSRARRGACFAIAAFWWAVLFFVEARATLLGLLVGGIVLWLARRRRAWPFLKTLLLTAAGGVALYGVLFVAMPVVAGMAAFVSPGNVLVRTAADPASGRQFMWKLAVELVARHPVLGIGPQHFAHAAADLGWAAHPHDWLLQIAVEWGVPALCCLVAILALGMRGLLRAGASLHADDAQGQATCAALVVAVVGVVVDSLFSGVLVMPQSQLALVLVFGIAAGWVRARADVAAAPAAGTGPRAGTALAAALCIMAATAGPDLERKWNDAPMTAQELAHNKTWVYWPRLWSAGFF